MTSDEVRIHFFNIVQRSHSHMKATHFNADIDVQSTSVQGHHVEMENIYDKVFCLLYPQILNCSWSFNTLQQDTQLFANISICDGNKSVQSLTCRLRRKSDQVFSSA
ncbi:hypothetical protein F7725_012298 [Dissostichus mawsoni]|uniref:Uncharacterized protein n=1 Tax=Dissostichus mawsoni TaxID=36200 RepID=A0A7J5YLY5_DISMA|nr:hypothetical protein F7725_012298 [Dissostichus mawsoni]